MISLHPLSRLPRKLPGTLLLAPLLALLAAGSPAPLGDPAAVPARPASGQEFKQLMNEFAGHFRDLQDQLEERHPAAILQASASLGTAARRLGDTLTIGRTGFVSALERGATRIPALTDEIAELTRQGRFAGAQQTFAELRANCVSCHVRFREDVESHGLYPALRGSVSGVIELVDMDGVEVRDRSGVLVYLERVGGEPRFVHERDAPSISQKGRVFAPPVLPVVRGTTVQFPNDDTVFHNVFSLSKAAPFDLGVYRQGESKSVTFDRAGLVKLYCNIHPDMESSIVILPGPHYALCDAEGRFVLTGVPDGDYVLRVWSEMGGEAEQLLKVIDGVLVRTHLRVKDVRRPTPHKNKYGQDYRKNYP